MRKFTVMVIAVFAAGMISAPVHAATFGYIDIQKVFSSYGKTKRTEEELKKKEQLIKDEVLKKQKQIEKERNNNMSDGDLRKLAEKFEKELEPQKAELMEIQDKKMQEIRNDIMKASEITAKAMGIDIVLDKQAIVSGGTDLSDKVIEQLNKK